MADENKEVVEEVVEKPVEKPEEKPVEKKEEKPVEKVVEPVKIDLKLAEKSLLSKEDLDGISAYAAKKGLTQEEAEQLLSDKEATAKRVQETFENSQVEQLEAQGKKWAEESKADPEIGGDKYEEAAELAKRVIDKFGSDALKKGLDEAKLGNYPELVRMMYRIGKAMDSDKLVIGNQVNNSQKSLEERLYGQTKKE